MTLFPKPGPEEELWPEYFVGEQFDSDDGRRLDCTLALADYFGRERKAAIRQQFERSGVVYLDYSTLNDENFPLDNFAELLRVEPANVIGCLQLAIHLMLLRENVEVKSNVIVRILNFGPHQQLQKLMRSSNVETFVSLIGTVVRMSSIQPLVTSMQFKCPACDSEVDIPFPDGKYEPPSSCTRSGCKSRSMQPDRTNAVTIDYQKIRLQELFSDTGAEIGRVPRSIEVELKQDLVDSCLPGDVVIVSGIIKATKADSRFSGGSRQETCLYILYVVANSIVNEKCNSALSERREVSNRSPDGDNSGSVSNSDSSFSLSDLQAIRKIHSSPHRFEFIVNSLCPGIFGHELVKAGLCLGLFSGVRRSSGTQQSISMRGDIHVLLLGDPGMGKSQLLRACTAVAPRAVYVCGNSTTTAGLTVSMVKDGNGDSALEAGALVLADRGLCCIDEFDKITSDPQALLEAMEQQSISVAKAGICCSLSARATVFVAANPIGGHYNRTKTMLENMKISPALLSRFDLVFVLVDDPDARRDELLSEHVLALHSGTSRRTQSSRSSLHTTQERVRVSHSQIKLHEDMSLANRIKLFARSSDSLGPIAPASLRKYIAYAKEFVRPRLSKGAKNILQAFYLTLRQQRGHITIRQLESLIRLSEARARMDLREVVTEQDASDAVEIMNASLFDLCSDGLPPPGAISDSKPRGSKKMIDAFMKAAKREACSQGSSIFTEKDLIGIAKAAGLDLPDYCRFFDQLNQANFILCKGGKNYQVL